MTETHIIVADTSFVYRWNFSSLAHSQSKVNSLSSTNSAGSIATVGKESMFHIEQLIAHPVKGYASMVEAMGAIRVNAGGVSRGSKGAMDGAVGDNRLRDGSQICAMCVKENVLVVALEEGMVHRYRYKLEVKN